MGGNRLRVPVRHALEPGRRRGRRVANREPYCSGIEAKKLKAVGGNLSFNVLERLERQRSLIPKLRLDAVTASKVEVAAA